jgi:hypothetical protein
MLKQATRGFRRGIRCGKSVAHGFITPPLTYLLPTPLRALHTPRVYNQVVLHGSVRRSSTAFTHTLYTNFTLLSSLLYTVSTAPIKNKNYRNIFSNTKAPVDELFET